MVARGGAWSSGKRQRGGSSAAVTGDASLRSRMAEFGPVQAGMK